MSDTRDPTSSTPLRVAICLLFGALFVGVALYIAFSPAVSKDFATIAVALVLGGLGLDLMISALRGKASWLSRLGPLP